MAALQEAGPGWGRSLPPTRPFHPGGAAGQQHQRGATQPDLQVGVAKIKEESQVILIKAILKQEVNDEKQHGVMGYLLTFTSPGGGACRP